MAGKVIGADRRSIADQVVALAAARTEVAGVGQRERPRRRRRAQLRRPVRDAEGAVVQQRDLAVRVTQPRQRVAHARQRLGDAAHQRLAAAARQRVQQPDRARVVHRRALEVAAVGKHLLGQLARQHRVARGEPALGLRAGEARAAQRQRSAVLQQVVAEQMVLEVRREPFGLQLHRPPQRAAQRGVLCAALGVEAEEVAAPDAEPQRDRVRLPAHLAAAQRVCRDPVEHQRARRLVGEREEVLEVVEVVGPQLRQALGRPARREAQLLAAVQELEAARQQVVGAVALRARRQERALLRTAGARIRRHRPRGETLGALDAAAHARRDLPGDLHRAQPCDRPRQPEQRHARVRPPAPAPPARDRRRRAAG